MNIHIAIKPPVGSALRQVFGLLMDTTQTQLESEYKDAKVVIVEDKAALVRLHTKDKFFVIFGDPRKNVGPLPKNAEQIPELSLQSIIQILSDEEAIDERIRQYASSPQIEKEVPIERVGSTGLKILVVDDSPRNRQLAKDGLGEHTLTVASSYGQAMSLIETEKFDVVLTDLYLPASQYHRSLSLEVMDFWQTVPYGILIALQTARRGMDVAIVTDANHHADFFSAAFDAMREPYIVGGKKLLLINYCGKDWVQALKLLRE